MVESIEMIVLRLLGTFLNSIDSYCQLVKQVDELKGVVAELQKEIALLKTAPQVGDRVRVNYGDGNMFRKGDTGIVVGIDDDDGDLQVDFTECQVGRMRGNGTGWVDPDCVTKLRNDES